MLLTGVIVGGALGLLFGDGVRFLRPFGQIFLNLIFVLVVPLVFFSIASSITGLQRSHVIGKVLLWSLVVFGGMSVIAGLLAYAGTLIWNPFTGMETITDGTLMAEKRSWGDLLVSSLTAPERGCCRSSFSRPSSAWAPPRAMRKRYRPSWKKGRK